MNNYLYIVFIELWLSTYINIITGTLLHNFISHYNFTDAVNSS